MRQYLSSLTGAFWLRLALLALVAFAIMFGVSQCRNARNSAAETRLSESQAGAVSNSAADAIGTVGAVSGRNSTTDQITMENADAISSAPGADAPVDRGVRDAGLVGLCRRAAYRSDPKCVRFTPAGGMARAGAGGAASGR